MSPLRTLLCFFLLACGLSQVLAAQSAEGTLEPATQQSLSAAKPSTDALHAYVLVVRGDSLSGTRATLGRRSVEPLLPSFLAPIPTWHIQTISEARFSYSAILPQPPTRALLLPLLN